MNYVIVNRGPRQEMCSGLTIKAIAIPSPWKIYPKTKIENALGSEGSITLSALKPIVPTSICGGIGSVIHRNLPE